MRAGSPPSVAHGVAHRGEVDDRGDAREVLQQHAAGVNAISPARLLVGFQRATASTSSAVTVTPSSRRSRFSSRTRSVYGSRATSYVACRASRR